MISLTIKFIKIIEAVKINEIFKTKAPFSNLKIRWRIRKESKKKVGSNAGYTFRLSIKFPFNNSINALCIPQPGHSIPKYFL